MRKLSFILTGLFAAFVCFGQGLVYPEYVSDIDGNSYNTVTIGDQVWTVENLRTTKYNDGTPITKNALAETWATGTEGKFAYFYNVSDQEFIKRYGALYNWHAVNTNKLAPKGWHVSTDEDWNTLEDYLIENGYNYDDEVIDNRMARSLAAKLDWTSHTNAGSVGENLENNNKSGFSALPGGYRDLSGMFKGLNTLAAWWTSLEFSATDAYTRGFTNDGNGLARTNFDKNFGFYVRLVRDKPASNGSSTTTSNATQTTNNQVTSTNNQETAFTITNDISEDWSNSNSGVDGYFYSISGTNDGSVFVAGSNGLLLSTNRGASWRNVLPGLITFVQSTSQNNFYAGGRGLYHSTDGVNWTKVKDNSSIIEGIVEIRSGKILAIAQNGDVFTTTDNGQNWTYSQLPRLTGNPAAMRLLSSAGAILVGGEKGILLRSTNEGVSWSQVPFPGDATIIGLWSPPGSPNTVYSTYNTSSDKGCLAKSNDGGATWSKWHTFPISSGYGNGAIWGKSSKDFYLLYLSDLLHTTDGGITWKNSTYAGAFNMGINAVGYDTYLVGLNTIKRKR